MINKSNKLYIKSDKNVKGPMPFADNHERERGERIHNRRDAIERRDFIKIRRPLNSPKTATSLPCHFYFAETAVYYVTMPRPDAPNGGELTAGGGEGTVAGPFYILTPLYTPHGQLYAVARARARAGYQYRESEMGGYVEARIISFRAF